MSPINKAERATMNQLVAAFDERSKQDRAGACLVRTVRKRDNKEVAMLCRSIPREDGGADIYPLAVLVPESEFDDYQAP